MQLLNQSDKFSSGNNNESSLISIIVPTFRRSSILRETLNVLSKLNCPKQNYEVIIVDDGSDDETPETVAPFRSKFNNFVYHYQSNSGASTARNQGAKLAKYDLLLFIDDDILLTEDAFEKIIQFHRSNQNCLLSGSWEYSPQVLEELNKTSFGRFKVENDYVCMGGIEKTPVAENLYDSHSLASFCLSMTKEVFNRIGGFNEDFPYAGCEDQEFSARALKSEVKLYYLTNIKTLHNELDRGSKAKWLQRQYTGVQGFPLLCEIFPERKASPLFIENSPITANDDLKMKAKKIFKKLTFGKTGFYILNSVTKLMEKTSAPKAILNKSYSVLGGMMLYQGFKVGRESLQDLEKRKTLNNTVKQF